MLDLASVRLRPTARRNPTANMAQPARNRARDTAMSTMAMRLSCGGFWSSRKWNTADSTATTANSAVATTVRRTRVAPRWCPAGIRPAVGARGGPVFRSRRHGTTRPPVSAWSRRSANRS